MFKIEIENGKAAVFTPYNKDFVSKIKLLGGKWDGSRKCWVIMENVVDDARKVMMDIYGQDDAPCTETVDVFLHFEEEKRSDHCSPYVLFGRTIASAFGRDSGAKVGDGVVFTEGEPQSGGSARYWYTVIPAGCTVKVFNVPKAALDNTVTPSGVTLEVIGAKIDVASLTEEKERLLARLEEIDKMLKGSL